MQDTIDLKEFYAGLDLMFQKNNGAETQRYLEGYLKQAENLGDRSGATAVCNELSGLYRVMGKLTEAKAVSRRVINNLEEMGLYHTEHYATALINLGDVYITAGEFEAALELFQQAMRLLESLGFSDDYRMAALCNNISAVYREIADLEAAEKALIRAFDIISGKPEYRAELGTTYINLAQLQIKQGKFQEARKNLTAAIDIFEREKGGRDPHYAAACAAMGEIGYYQADYVMAETYFTKAMDLIERDYGRTASWLRVQKNLQQVKELQKGQR